MSEIEAKQMCCKISMDFKNAVTSVNAGWGEWGYHYFYQCKKCGKVKRIFVEVKDD